MQKMSETTKHVAPLLGNDMQSDRTNSSVTFSGEVVDS